MDIEAQILQELGVDYVDESEVLTPADEAHHVDKHAFKVPFVCGARNLGEALRRIAEGARCPALSLAIEKTHALASTWFCVARSQSDDTGRTHSDLVNVIVAGDPAKAAEAMRAHVNRGMENTMKRLKPYFRIRKVYGKTFFRSEKRQKQQIIDPSALN